MSLTGKTQARRHHRLAGHPLPVAGAAWPLAGGAWHRRRHGAAGRAARRFHRGDRRRAPRRICRRECHRAAQGIGFRRGAQCGCGGKGGRGREFACLPRRKDGGPQYRQPGTGENPCAKRSARLLARRWCCWARAARRAAPFWPWICWARNIFTSSIAIAIAPRRSLLHSARR